MSSAPTIDLSTITDNAPECIRQLPQWVAWKYVDRDGKPTKAPVNPRTGALAKSTEPDTWGTFEEAIAACQSDSGLAGVGFVFAAGDEYCGVDLDDSVDPDSGQLKGWAADIVERLDSYTEISPSGTGLKVFLKANKPGSRCRKAYHDGEVEIYDNGRFAARSNGHRDFVCLIGSDEGHAMDMLDSIKMELDGNDLLLEDYPEVVYPIQCLDGIANRCNGQLYQGERTYIGWTAREVVLPTIPGSIASGAIIKVAGITGRIRGMKYKRADGHTVRPTLVVIDDPQTDESARSLSQCATRESILAGAILGLAGPGKKISGIMPCTVIRPSDMADNILSREKHPEWNGERTKMVYAFPTDEKLWQRYGELRAESLRLHGDIRLATEFYVAHREAMDLGASVAWAERLNHDEASAIQHAMNLKLQDEAAFFAEYQNEPLPATASTDDELTADAIASKTNRMARCGVPIGCNHLTMFVDVQANLLFFVVTAWEDNFTGYVLDYGSFPDQKRPYFTLRDARNTLSLATKASGLEGAIYAGLEQLTEDYLSREWKRDDGAMLRIDRCLVDANWGSSTDVVYQFCRQSAHASVIMPSHGRFVGASSQPFSEYQRRPGDRLGLNWRVPNVRGKRAVRHVVYDTNFWKSFVHSRLAVTMGDRGCLSLFGDSPDQHRLLAEHLSAEYRVKTEGRGRTVDEWKMRPERGDNHWFDGLVGCAVAASMQGVSLQGPEATSAPTRERVSFAELQRSRRQ